ncbi:hypothetical protein MKX01_026438 [Papaver californicum]|nr:hypothetical protein MKX01_026438 [Papaver californicum]
MPDLLRNKPAYKWILEFLKTEDQVFATRPRTMVTDYMSRGFLFVGVTPLGDQWKKMRKVTPWLLEKRNEEANNLVFFLPNQCSKNPLDGGEVFNLRLLTRELSGNVNRKMVFNKRYIGTGRKDGGPGSNIYAFGIQDYFPYLRCLDLHGHEKDVKGAVGVMNKYHDPIIEERIRQWTNEAIKKKDPEDLLDVLISLKDDYGKLLLSTYEIKAQTVESDFPKLNFVKACATLRIHPVSPFNLPQVSQQSDTVVSEGTTIHIIYYWTTRCIGGQLGTAILIMLLARLIQGFEWSAPPSGSMIDLSESYINLFLAKLLFAHARPRMPTHIYHGRVIKLFFYFKKRKELLRGIK